MLTFLFSLPFSNLGMFILLAALLVLTICGLTVMRNDAGRLVLDPLRRMLKIVVRCEFALLFQAVEYVTLFNKMSC